MDKTEIEKYTPMMQQYLEIKKDYADFIVFFRLGDFYEMFFQDALVASKELEIVLTGRDAGAPERVPMCGVPYHAVQVYSHKLIEKGYKIAIVEQVEDPALAKGLVKREVIKILTPGTLMEEGSLDEKTNNFICSIHETKEHFLLAYSDISTGQNAIVSLPKDLDIVTSEIMNLGSREIVIASDFRKSRLHQVMENRDFVLSIEDQTEIPVYYRTLSEDLYDKDMLKCFGRLLNYLILTQKRELLHLQKVEVFEATSYLMIDNNSKRNLELTETLRSGNKKGSLFWLLDKCSTAMGSRKLKQTILRPSVDRKRIEDRFSLVTSFNDQFVISEELRNALKNVYDLERITGRLSFGNANAKDLVQLKRSLMSLPSIVSGLNALHNEYALELCDAIADFSSICEIIERAIIENPPLSITEGGFIRPGYHSGLDEILGLAQHVETWLNDFERTERERTGISRLRIGYNRVFGYYIEVTKGQLELVKDEFGYVRKQTLANAERYVTEELKTMEEKILSAKERSVQLEYELFLELRAMAIEQIAALQKTAKSICEVDMLLSFSKSALENSYVRPLLTDKRVISIVSGRHPVVEKMLEQQRYVENDVEMPQNKTILLITGPNMSGKSTYMRQLALSVVMAQMGCFIPAQKAILPLFDKIFTRIGASDDTTSGKSTFMVEMLEVEHALKNATQNSLILFDEIGRGTATYDGMALAQAIIEYAHHALSCKVLFSTHYHELTYLEDDLKALHNVHVVAKEDKGKIVFLHKVLDGPTDKSYGIHVAELAKMPAVLIRRAKEILSELEKNHGYNIIKPQTIDLFNYEDATVVNEKEEHAYASVIEQIESLDLNSMTPLQAMNVLSDIVTEINKLKQS